jgi:NAD-dependent dihydropyrimidine dehydrogenase PreA subunit
MAGLGKARDAAKEAYWRQQVRLWQESFLPVRAFCERHDVPLDSFYRWRRLLAERDRPPSADATSAGELAVFQLPILDETRCTGCGDCVSVCPVTCLEMSGPLPWLPRPADCVSCAVCAAVCPAEAITMSADERRPQGGS